MNHQVALSAKGKVGLFLSVIVAALCMTSSVWARPVFIAMDVDSREDAPKNFGYEVMASRVEKQTEFVIHLDPSASIAFRSAHIFFHTPVKHKPNVFVHVSAEPNKKSKQITFVVPTEHLVHCMLQINSKVLRPQDNVINFNAYRLRLDNIKP